MKEVSLWVVKGENRQKTDIVVVCAHSWLRRLKGLLGTLSLPNNRGLWLKPCNSIHCMGMLYTIDVAFLDADGGIAKLAPKIIPMGFSLAPDGVESVLELNAGGIERLGLEVGDRLEFIESTE